VVLRKGLWALAPFVVALLALAPAPALAGCEKANLNNPGHHYGLYKNGCLQLPVVIPTPTPKPTPKPVNHPPHSVPVASDLSSTNNPNHATGVTNTLIQISDGNPPPVTLPGSENFDDTNLWLITALLPTLLVLWLLIAGRTLTEALRRRRKATPAA
jgi:hypothetical protein